LFRWKAAQMMLWWVNAAGAASTSEMPICYRFDTNQPLKRMERCAVPEAAPDVARFIRTIFAAVQLHGSAATWQYLPPSAPPSLEINISNSMHSLNCNSVIKNAPGALPSGKRRQLDFQDAPTIDSTAQLSLIHAAGRPRRKLRP
jgi:hypothetical protein